MSFIENIMEMYIQKLCGLLVLLLFFACNSSSSDSSGSVQAPPFSTEPVVTKGAFEFEGTTYGTITVNGTTWLGKNLDLEVEDSWCYSDEKSYCSSEGRLYRWKAAQKACEALGDDWRLATDEEWIQLCKAFGGYHDWLTDRPTGDAYKANRLLIEGGQVGFGAPLGGWRGSRGGFDAHGKGGFFWTGTDVDGLSAWYFQFAPRGGKVVRRQSDQRMGMSCRCVKSN